MSGKGFKGFKDAIVRLEGVMTDPKYVGQAGEFVLSAAKMKCSGFKMTSGELRNSLSCTVRNEYKGIYAHVGTMKKYAAYVEFGTGPVGAAHHAGTAPDVPITYTMHPWWIPEWEISPEVPEFYGWDYIETDIGRFYRCSGQPAHPYLYPAFRDNQKEIEDILAHGFEEVL